MTARRSIMTLYSDGSDLASHQVRIVLAEKEVAVELIAVDKQQLPPDLVSLNPYHTFPILVDRDLILYESRIIMEFLEERFPHPPLLPGSPIARAKARLTLYRIEQDWYTLATRIESAGKRASDAARKDLENSLISLLPVFSATPYFLNTDFSLIDCCIAPLLWRLPKLGIHLTTKTGLKIGPFLNYSRKIFKRPSFQSSLTELEREFPKDDFD